MSLYGALDGTKHFSEFGDPLVTQAGVLSAATRKATALANLGLTSTAAELNVLAGVTAGSVAASKALVVDANRDLGVAAATAIRNLLVTNLDAGISGTAGSVDIFPTTASKGKLSLTAADSAGDTTTTIVNASQSGVRTYTIPDAGASASFLMTEGSQTVNGARIQVGNLTFGSDATDRVLMKGIYMNSVSIAVAVPTIANDAAENVDRVDVDVSASFSIQPAVGDAVIAIPQEALPTDCVLLGAYVTATDHITVTFGSIEGGGGVTGANKNFKFLVVDLT